MQQTRDEMQHEALTRAASGQSFMNLATIYRGFIAMESPRGTSCRGKTYSRTTHGERSAGKSAEVSTVSRS